MTMPQTRHYEMKDSGVEWIGKMPSNWQVKYLFQLASQVKNKNNDLREKNLLSLSYGKIKRKDIETTDGLLPASFDGYNIIEEGDIVMRLTDLQNDHTSLRVGRASERGIITSAYTTVRPSKETSPFLYLALHSFDVKKGFYGMGAGVRQGLNYGEVKKVLVPVPPLSEQAAIAAYLDEKCATIDAIIAEAKASIEEYKSWKASVIFETVTKGLNPYAEMKDSGVEWIGEIPKGWKVSAVKRHYSITLGKMLESVPQSNDATLENYMCASNVKWGGIDTTTNRQMWFSPIEKEEYLLKEGDLLVMEGGSAGTSAIYRGEYAPCYMQNSVNRCRSKDGSLTHFLYYWMFLVYHSGHVESACNRATIMHLTKEKLGRLPFVYAPKEEQASIVSYLDRKCSLIDGIIAEKEDLIRELENYKRSLIFEVVTGKRRVC